MTRRSLADIDLNLLVALDALLREESVTRAAAELGLTQSAASRALNRLRAELDDPLLVRRGPSLVKTPLGEKLAPDVAAAIEAVTRVFDARRAFEPARAVRRFTVIASDYAQVVVIPPLLERLATLAPSVDLAVRVAREPERALADRDAALMIGVARDAPSSLRRQLLFADGLVVMARAGHPALEDLTLERYCAASHVLVSPRAMRGGLVDDALRARGFERRVALEVPHFLVAPIVVAQSDLLVTLPARLAERVAAPFALATAPLPVQVPDIEFVQLWHERDHADAGNAWLRARVAEVARAP